MANEPSNDEATAPRRSCRARRINSRFINDEVDEGYRQLVARIAAPDSHSILQSPQLAFHSPQPPPPPRVLTPPPPPPTTPAIKNSDILSPQVNCKKIPHSWLPKKAKLKPPSECPKLKKSNAKKVSRPTSNDESTDSEDDVPLAKYAGGRASPALSDSSDDLPLSESIPKHKLPEKPNCALPSNFTIKTIHNPDLSSTPISIVCIEDPEEMMTSNSNPSPEKPQKKSFSKMFLPSKKKKLELSDTESGQKKKKIKFESKGSSSSPKLLSSNKLSDKSPRPENLKKLSNPQKKFKDLSNNNDTGLKSQPPQGKFLKILNIKLDPTVLSELSDNNPLRKLVQANSTKEDSTMNVSVKRPSTKHEGLNTSSDTKDCAIKSSVQATKPVINNPVQKNESVDVANGVLSDHESSKDSVIESKLLHYPNNLLTNSLQSTPIVHAEKNREVERKFSVSKDSVSMSPINSPSEVLIKEETSPINDLTVKQECTIDTNEDVDVSITLPENDSMDRKTSFNISSSSNVSDDIAKEAKIACKRKSTTLEALPSKKLKQEVSDLSCDDKVQESTSSAFAQESSLSFKIEGGNLCDSGKEASNNSELVSKEIKIKEDHKEEKPDLSLIKDTREQTEVEVKKKTSGESSSKHHKSSSKSKQEGSSRHKSSSRSSHSSSKERRSHGNKESAQDFKYSINDTKNKEEVLKEKKSNSTAKDEVDAKPDIKPDLLITKIVEGTGMDTKPELSQCETTATPSVENVNSSEVNSELKAESAESRTKCSNSISSSPIKNTKHSSEVVERKKSSSPHRDSHHKKSESDRSRNRDRDHKHHSSRKSSRDDRQHRHSSSSRSDHKRSDSSRNHSSRHSSKEKSSKSHEFSKSSRRDKERDRRKEERHSSRSDSSSKSLDKKNSKDFNTSDISNTSSQISFSTDLNDSQHLDTVESSASPDKKDLGNNVDSASISDSSKTSKELNCSSHRISSPELVVNKGVSVSPSTIPISSESNKDSPCLDKSNIISNNLNVEEKIPGLSPCKTKSPELLSSVKSVETVDEPKEVQVTASDVVTNLLNMCRANVKPEVSTRNFKFEGDASQLPLTNGLGLSPCNSPESISSPFIKEVTKKEATLLDDSSSNCNQDDHDETKQSFPQVSDVVLDYEKENGKPEAKLGVVNAEAKLEESSLMLPPSDIPLPPPPLTSPKPEDNILDSPSKDIEEIKAKEETPEEKLMREIESEMARQAREARNKAVVEERLKSFEHLTENLYLIEKRRSKQSKEIRRMVCDCSLTKEELQRGEKGCTEDCLNRLLMIEW